MIGLIELGMLWFAHCMGDMVLQTKFLADFKSKYLYPMLTHVFIWSASISFMLNFLGIFAPWKFAFLFLGHWAMDNWKSKQPRDHEHMWCMYVDQGWHFIQIVIVGVL